jgi:hypothetical protein
VPNTLSTIPGAKSVVNDAPFATPAMLTDDDAPTTNVTGTLSASGVPEGDCTTSIAEYAPFESPAADAETVIVFPDCETVSQPGLAGSTDAVQRAVVCTCNVAVALASVSVSDAGATASGVGDAAAPAKLTVTFAVTVALLSEVPVMV